MIRHYSVIGFLFFWPLISDIIGFIEQLMVNMRQLIFTFPGLTEHRNMLVINNFVQVSFYTLQTNYSVFFLKEINLLWAAHQVHHSSEDLNISVSLRQSVVQQFVTWVSIRRTRSFLHQAPRTPYIFPNLDVVSIIYVLEYKQN